MGTWNLVCWTILRMAENEAYRSKQIEWLESEAELLFASQLDLVAQLESQLRAIHHTMRYIEKLRSAKNRVGPELSNGERSDTLASLNLDLVGLEHRLTIQHRSCQQMQENH